MVKMSGAGNTFVMVTDREAVGVASRADWARRLCDKIKGVAADGVVILSQGTGDCDLIWDFYNADGSKAEMCGNAARCVWAFAVHHLRMNQQNKIRLKTEVGILNLTSGPNGIAVKMPLIKVLQPMLQLPLNVNNQCLTKNFALVNSGVPHLVCEQEGELGTTEQSEWASVARRHSQVGPGGANVTLWQSLVSEQVKNSKSQTGRIRAVSFERGVEGFTLACGTGAVAAAYVAARKNNLNEVFVDMPGGTLHVDFRDSLYEPIMSGPAEECLQFVVEQQG